MELVAGYEYIAGEDVHRGLAADSCSAPALADGTATTYAYDSSGRLLTVRVGGAAGTPAAREVAGAAPGGKVALKIGAKAIGKTGVRAVTRSTLRRRMMEEGPPPEWMVKPEAHHDLAQAFRGRFEKIGLDIDDPAYGRWVPMAEHRKLAWQFNQEWRRFFERFPNPTPEQVLAKMEELRGKFH